MEPLASYYVTDKHNHRIAQGVILPSGAFAMYWFGDMTSHGTYPSLRRFKEIQSQMRGRAILPDPSPLTTNHLSRTFYLQRNEDWNGISGTGQVAIGFEFDHIAVLQWLDSEGGTFWYPSVNSLERVHGHEGRTVIVRAPY